jgi:hypothetical protein
MEAVGFQGGATLHLWLIAGSSLAHRVTPPPSPPPPLYPYPAWAGFSNSGVITIAMLFVIAKCIEVSGTIDDITRFFLGHPKRMFIAQLRFQLPTAIISAFVANTPLVAAMMPVISSWTTRISMPVSQFMVRAPTCGQYWVVGTGVGEPSLNCEHGAREEAVAVVEYQYLC